ncbi:hypothetical protein AFLA_012934 [Aspergillus flavus NRRL3357]|nr:hypothetical protein AFLA_012934 [Aspergillus flavus NRRL3357]
MRPLFSLPSLSTPRASKPTSLQDIVTYDADSLFVKCERIFMLAGEYAPSRDPVPSVWLDAVEKVGLLGWLQRVKDILRTTAPNLLSAIDNYMSHVYKIIADAQITNGGLVILLQAENEYSMFEGEALGLDRQYMQYFIDKARDAGIVVPITSNDANNNGYNAPGTGLGVIDIYGYDQYPIGVGCYNLYDWPAG